jgi:uncharacterized SAM-binding protein YcdF (DUF218 family)
LSARGFVVLGFTFVTVLVVLIRESHPFLAITSPVPSDTLVVEGWMNEYGIQQAAAEYANGHYRHLFTTGGPTMGNGGYINDYNTSASVGAELLMNAGIPREAVQMVPSKVIGRDRTYNSAIALKNWFNNHDFHARSVNVITAGCHARRTRLLFKKALGGQVTVGIIAVASPDYDAARWWRYSEGVEEVVKEGVAYLYARLFF